MSRTGRPAERIVRLVLEWRTFACCGVAVSWAVSETTCRQRGRCGVQCKGHHSTSTSAGPPGAALPCHPPSHQHGVQRVLRDDSRRSL